MPTSLLLSACISPLTSLAALPIPRSTSLQVAQFPPGSLPIPMETRQQLESRVDTLHSAQLDLISSLQTAVPDLVSSLDLSLRAISAFNNAPFTPLSQILPPKPAHPKTHIPKLPPDNPKRPKSPPPSPGPPLARTSGP
ncbi:N6-adenosine-methyltransferase MT-A70-like [Striga asiatica]|uniref:N6-adenosine-methyltransferase MT-A70-like n=1 Tax=Striga asiatica TaxID=4170 RepID=A0A5A7QEF7_STRAF|nr:N6-adenosine-methyltransferase MT-A70-like [Striga asiatica]